MNKAILLVAALTSITGLSSAQTRFGAGAQGYENNAHMPITVYVTVFFN